MIPACSKNQDNYCVKNVAHSHFLKSLTDTELLQNQYELEQTLREDKLLLQRTFEEKMSRIYTERIYRATIRAKNAQNRVNQIHKDLQHGQDSFNRLHQDLQYSQDSFNRLH